MVKPVTAALLADEPVALAVEAGNADWLSEVSFAPEALLSVRVTDRNAIGPDELVLHPPVLAVGVGCERGAEASELLALVRQCLDEAGLAPGAVACLTSIALKMDEAAVHATAHALGASPAL